MIGGVALIGVVTASRAQVDALRAELADLRAQLGVPAVQSDADPPPPPD